MVHASGACLPVASPRGLNQRLIAVSPPGSLANVVLEASHPLAFQGVQKPGKKFMRFCLFGDVLDEGSPAVPELIRIVLSFHRRESGSFRQSHSNIRRLGAAGVFMARTKGGKRISHRLFWAY